MTRPSSSRAVSTNSGGYGLLRAKGDTAAERDPPYNPPEKVHPEVPQNPLCLPFTKGED
jgi:hypothetical protein